MSSNRPFQIRTTTDTLKKASHFIKGGFEISKMNLQLEIFYDPGPRLIGCEEQDSRFFLAPDFNSKP